MKKELDIMQIITTDEYAGMGGSYIIDPKTGKRRPVEEVAEPPAAPANEQNETIIN